MLKDFILYWIVFYALFLGCGWVWLQWLLCSEDPQSTIVAVDRFPELNGLPHARRLRIIQRATGEVGAREFSRLFRSFWFWAIGVATVLCVIIGLTKVIEHVEWWLAGIVSGFVLVVIDVWPAKWKEYYRAHWKPAVENFIDRFVRSHWDELLRPSVIRQIENASRIEPFRSKGPRPLILSAPPDTRAMKPVPPAKPKSATNPTKRGGFGELGRRYRSKSGQPIFKQP